MTILLTILKIIGILLLSLAGLLLFLLLAALLLSVFKAKVTLAYEEETFCFQFRYLFLSFGEKQNRKNRIKKETEKADKPTEEKKEKRDKENEPEEKSFFEKTVDGLTFSDYLAILKLIFRKAVTKIKIEEFFADIRIGGDAYDVAMEYGKINSAMYPLLGFLHNVGALKEANVNIVPDFLRQKTAYHARVTFSLRLIHLLLCAAAVIWYISKCRKKED